MKYQHLIQICEFLQNFKTLSHIKRVGDNLFKLSFDSYELFFDMNKTACNIHKNGSFVENKIYKAPFDGVLAKRLVKSKILQICVVENNRILHIKTELKASYKAFITNLYFEFTGRFTNVIITDENGVILEALRHLDNDVRSVRVGRVLAPLPPYKIKEKNVEKIENFDDFFVGEFEKLNLANLAQIRNSKLTQIDKKIEILHANLNAVPKESELLAKAENLANLGQVLSANLYNLSDWQREFCLSDENGESVEFRLENPPKIAMNEFFNEAKKLRQKAANSHIQIANLNEKIEFYENLKNLIANAKTCEELEILLPKKRISVNLKEKNAELVQSFYIGEFKISVGKNEKGNEFLLKNSAKNDFWFHLKDRASAHVIVRTNKQNLSEEIANFAAKICVNFSVKEAGNYLVDYTKRLNVSPVKGSFVHYVDYKTIGVLKP
ncbi:MAG: DUF814 domain-containing protein [Campylobacter sp.]|nr:DUF814 domain-containing protein [Campylobacter sp.]